MGPRTSFKYIVNILSWRESRNISLSFNCNNESGASLNAQSVNLWRNSTIFGCKQIRSELWVWINAPLMSIPPSTSSSSFPPFLLAESSCAILQYSILLVMFFVSQIHSTEKKVFRRHSSTKSLCVFYLKSFINAPLTTIISSIITLPSASLSNRVFLQVRRHTLLNNRNDSN